MPLAMSSQGTEELSAGSPLPGCREVIEDGRDTKQADHEPAVWSVGPTAAWYVVKLQSLLHSGDGAGQQVLSKKKGKEEQALLPAALG